MKKYCTGEVTGILDKIPIVENLWRKRFVVMFVLAMIKTRAVQFCEIAEELNNEAKPKSNENRIQDFFREVPLNYEQVALLLAFFMPKKGKVTLSIDRTEWDFGKFQCNILMIVAKCRDITIPLYWELLDNNSGNSNTSDRIDLLKTCIRILGVKRIGLFLGDREFIGHEWLKYLKQQGILFCVRVPKHHKITRYTNNLNDYDDFIEEKTTVEELLSKIGSRKVIRITGCMVDGIWGNMYAKKVKSKTGKDDILFLFGTAKTEYLGQFYRCRWTIECFFQNIKGRGFNLKSTHLKQAHKLKKLVAMVCIAYSFCTDMGLHYHKKIKAIPVKNHGYKANSFSRKGIDFIRSAINREWKRSIHNFLDYIIKFIRWIELNPNNIPVNF